ncbi:hypothetical protein C0J52_00857 [Blattella germanica]|nr:hypothetical protein C0J52_00857 [Blattella germanica]
MGRLPYLGNGRERRNSLVPPASLLLMSVLGSIGMAAGSVLILGPEDRISLTRGVWLSLLGLIFFVSLFDLLNHVALRTSVGHMFRKKYELTLAEVMDISNKTVSAVQALLSCLTGSIVCIWSCTRNFLRSSHFMSEAYAWFGAAYFFYDIWSMYRVHSSSSNNTHGCRYHRLKDYLTKQPVIVLHHLFIGSFGFLVIVMKSSQLYVINGLVMLVTFFFCRVVMFPYVCYLYSQLVGLSYWEAILSLPVGCKIGISILMLPQLYWFVLMLYGAIRVFACRSKHARLS